MTKPLHKKLVDAALNAWAAFLIAEFLPIERKTLAVTTSGYENTDWRPMPKVTGEHANPVLYRLIASERHGRNWTGTIHALIMDMPKPHRIALLCAAVRGNIDEAAQWAGVKTHRLRICEGMARRSLALSLAVMDHVRRGEVAQRIEQQKNLV